MDIGPPPRTTCVGGMLLPLAVIPSTFKLEVTVITISIKLIITDHHRSVILSFWVIGPRDH